MTRFAEARLRASSMMSISISSSFTPWENDWMRKTSAPRIDTSKRV